MKGETQSMSQYKDLMAKKAVALRYDENKEAAPVIVASGLGYVAEKIVEIGNFHRVWRKKRKKRKKN